MSYSSNPYPNRLDVDTIDNLLGDAIRMFVGTLAQIVGAVVLVSIVQPYFLIAVTIILIAYYWMGIYYRPSAREIRVCMHPTFHFVITHREHPSRGWMRCFGRHFMRISRNPLMVYPQSGPTGRPHGFVLKTLQGWMPRIGVYLLFVMLGRTDGRSEAPTGCRSRLNDGSVSGWISSELCYSLQSLPWLSLPGTPSLLQRPASSSRTLLPPSKRSAG